MRIMIKGGVWKNTEDEILKAAVMKYGKNQWARISSLLVRKSAKQCKARWYEWLDPSIKKTEWTREEDEKLLHLAKLMPTQWRTIAPIVGRTPSQCLERYEKLLDAACVKDENYEPNDDPRKLRPGEIDPNPESKPARPDPVDMDEDEKEMLSEARARLANTRGKKAKRKAREKQLEEARRLASLQKRRELKAAGIDTRQRKRKRRGIDYNAEIPFEKKPPPGFFDVADEDRAVEQPKFPTTIEELEGKRRVDVEAQLRKQDIARNKIAQRQDAPSSILQVNKLNDPETVRKRSKLMLPAPQISDHELEEIAKMGYASDLVSGSEDLAGGSGATHTLLANYSETSRQGMTPFRTPQRTPGGKGDAIMMEAENLARLRESQTPLLGGDNPELHPSDFSGVTPKKREIQTPNPIATPSATPGPMGLTPRIGMTPSNDGSSFGMTPRGTPLRDELRINEDMEMHDSAKLEQRRQAEWRRNLRSGLTNLPQPKNEYQVVIQPLPEESEEQEEKIEEDMSDKLAREKSEEEARQQALLRKQSKVLQRELPRPPAASLELIRNSLMRANEDKNSFVPPTSIEKADEMIQKELLTLLEHDNAKYPLDENAVKEKRKGGKRSSKGVSAISIPEIEDFEEDVLKEADLIIKEEVEFLRVAMGHENEALDEFVKAHDACQEDLMYFPTRNAYGLSSVAGNSEKLEALQNEFENVKSRMDDETKKAQRLEQKIKLLTNGYQMRAGKLWSEIEATFKQMDTAATELECFRVLQKQEQLAATYRIGGLSEEIKKLKELEQHLQSRYGILITEQDRIQRLLEEYQRQAQIQEEIAANNRARELAELAKIQSDMNTVSAEALASSEGDSLCIDQPDAPALTEQVDTLHEHAKSVADMEVDGERVSAIAWDASINEDATEGDKSMLVEGNDSENPNQSGTETFGAENGASVPSSSSDTEEKTVSVLDQMPSEARNIVASFMEELNTVSANSDLETAAAVEQVVVVQEGIQHETELETTIKPVSDDNTGVDQVPTQSEIVVEVLTKEGNMVAANGSMEEANKVAIQEQVIIHTSTNGNDDAITVSLSSNEERIKLKRKQSCQRREFCMSECIKTISIECTPSLEDLELSQQMNALGLPVSFSTSKKGAVVKKVKRKGNTEKQQFVHENDEDGTKGVSKLENGEVVSPTNFHDKRNVSLCSIPTMTQCETLYSHNAEEVNEPLLTFKDEGLLSMTTKICNAAGLKEACEETGSVVENCGNHVYIPVSTMSNCIEEAAANPIDGDYEYSPDTSVPRDLMDTKLVRSRSSTGLETEKLCVDGTSKQTCIPDSVVSSVVTEHILVNESGNYEQCKDLGNWKTFWDAYYERVYYYNMKTNESTWYPPPGVDYLAFSDSKGEPTAMVIDPSKTDDILLCQENKFQNPCDVQGYGISLLECCYEHLDQPDGVTVFSKVKNNCEEEEAPFCSTISDKQNGGDSLSAQLSQLGSEVWSSDPPLLSMDSKIDAVDANNSFDGLEKIISREDAYKIFDDSTIQVSDADIFSEMNGNDLQLEDVICTTDALDNKHGSATRKKKKKVRRMRRKVFSNENEGLEHESMPEEFSDDITKYWCQRYSLFSRFDDGIKMDEEGWFSVTPELIAKHHATRCGSGVIIDCFTGVGGNAIQLAKRSNNVIAIDIDPQKIEYAQHNAAIYGVDGSIDFINGDFFQLAPKLKAETVFLSPPWGGPDYVKVRTYDINTMLKPCDGHILFNTSRAIASKIIMFLPRNVNLNQLAEISLSANPPWALEVEKNFLNGKLKAITAYFSDTPL